MNGFVIKYVDMENLLQAYQRTLSEVMENISLCQQGISTIVEDPRFTGQTADSVRDYLDDVHLTILDSFQVLVQNMLDDMALYKAGYHAIDEATNFIFTEEAMQEFRSQANRKLSQTEDLGDEVQEVLASVSDLISLSCPSRKNVEQGHGDIDTMIRNLIADVSDQESATVSNIENTSEMLLSSLRACVSKLGSGTLHISGYQAGSFFTDEDVKNMVSRSQSLYDSHLDNEDWLDRIWTREAVLAAEAEQRRTDGIWKTVGSILMIAGGAACIVLTAGAATPIVVAAVMAGGGTILFGVADTAEGAQEIHHGSAGDIDSESRNLLQERAFRGNQELYRTVEEVFACSSSALIPIGGLSAAGKLTIQSASMAAANAFISDAAGSATSKAITNVTGNEMAGLLTGMAVASLTGVGLDALDFSITNENVIYKSYRDKVKTENVEVDSNCASSSSSKEIYAVHENANFREVIWNKETWTEEITSSEIEYGMEIQEIVEEKKYTDSSQVNPVGAN